MRTLCYVRAPEIRSAPEFARKGQAVAVFDPDHVASQEYNSITWAPIHAKREILGCTNGTCTHGICWAFGD
jgi:hypothetical protein